MPWCEVESKSVSTMETLHNVHLGETTFSSATQALLNWSNESILVNFHEDDTGAGH